MLAPAIGVVAVYRRVLVSKTGKLVMSGDRGHQR